MPATAGVEVVGAAGQRGGVDRAGRGAGDHRERIAGRAGAGLAPDLRDRLQHADLVGGARAAAGEDQPGERSRASPCIGRGRCARFTRRRRTARPCARRPRSSAPAPRRSDRSGPRRRGRARRSRARAAARRRTASPCGTSPCSVGDAARREVAQHLGDRRHAAVDLDPQVLAEAAARAGQVPDLLHVEAQAAARSDRAAPCPGR